jgi:hypothetical protein
LDLECNLPCRYILLQGPRRLGPFLHDIATLVHGALHRIRRFCKMRCHAICFCMLSSCHVSVLCFSRNAPLTVCCCPFCSEHLDSESNSLDLESNSNSRHIMLQGSHILGPFLHDVSNLRSR